jgi:bifunctional non-homologous end joining protein LigD
VSFLSQIEDNPNYVAAKKWRGIRFLFHINDSGNKLVTRNDNDKIVAVPQFKRHVALLDGTVLDCEGVTPSDRTEDAKSVFGRESPSKDHMDAKLVLFDCLTYKGKSLINLPFRVRREYLEKAYRILKDSGLNVVLEKLSHKGKTQQFEDILKRGGEGIVVKQIESRYYPGERSAAWIKVKESDTYDFVIMGFTKGKGKYSSQIGAIIYGAYVGGELKRLGTSGGMTDAERMRMTRNPRKYIGRVAEFEATEITTQGVMLHPRFVGVRFDKSAGEVVVGN